MKVRFVQIFAIACVALVLPACSRQNSPIDAEGVSALASECPGDYLLISKFVFDSVAADGRLRSGAMSVYEFKDEVAEIMEDVAEDAAICLSNVAPRQRNCQALAMCFQAFADQNL